MSVLPKAEGPALVPADFRVGFAVWFATSVIVLGSGVFGWMMVRPFEGERAPTLERAFLAWDGGWYNGINDFGYFYIPERGSNVAFFPGYPIFGKIVAAATGLSNPWSLVLASQVSLAVGFVLFHAWVRRRFDRDTALWATLIFALFPTTFCFHMAHSEAFFFALVMIVLTLVERGALLWHVAIWVGLASGTRPVGVALLLPLVREIWLRPGGLVPRALKCLGYGALACWGLFGYVAYLQLTFGEPLAFAKTQHHWNLRPEVPLADKIVGLLILKPIWGSFVPGSDHHAAMPVEGSDFRMPSSAANAVFFVLAAGAVAVGLRRRWLTWGEGLAGIGLLLIPYVFRGYDRRFLSFARFAAVIAPTYIVLAVVTRGWPRYVKVSVLLLAGWVLSIAAALFAAGYAMI